MKHVASVEESVSGLKEGPLGIKKPKSVAILKMLDSKKIDKMTELIINMN